MMTPLPARSAKTPDLHRSSPLENVPVLDDGVLAVQHVDELGVVAAGHAGYPARGGVVGDDDGFSELSVYACLSGMGVAVSGGRRDCGEPELDGAGAGSAVDLGEFVFGTGEADLESFGFAEPPFAFSFGDAVDEVVADLGDAVPLGGVWPVHAAPKAALTEMIL